MTDENRRFTDKFALRLPDGLRDVLAAKAKENNRSTNAEIVARLERSIQEETEHPQGGLAFVKTVRQAAAKTDSNRLAEIESRLSELENSILKKGGRE